MIITLELKCIDGAYYENEFKCIFEIDDATTLDDFHQDIQQLIGFDDDHMYEFFIARSPSPYGKRSAVFCDEEMSFQDETESIYDTTLEDIFPLEEKESFYYYFDFGDSWIFKIKRTRHKEKDAEKGAKYPKVLKTIGEKPEQYPDWEDE